MRVIEAGFYMSKKRLTVVALFVVLIVVAMLLSPVGVFGQATAPQKASAKAHALTVQSQKTEAPQKSSLPQLSVAIPIAEVAAKAADVTNQIRDMQAKLAPSELTESIGSLLPRKVEQVSQQLNDTRKTLKGEPTLSVLQNQQQLWQQTQGDINIWLQVLTKRATLIRENLIELETLEAIWSKTLGEAVKANAPQPILQQIKGVIESVSTEKASLGTQRTAVLDLQSNVAGELTKCNDILALISHMQQRVMGGIFTRDSLPIWKPSLWTYLADSFPKRLSETIPEWSKEFSRYMGGAAFGLPLHIGLFIVFAIFFSLARRSIHRWKADGAEISAKLLVFDRPFAAALFLTLSIASGPHTFSPPIVKVIFEILIFAPIVRLVRSVADRRALPELYTLWVLFALDAFRQELSGGLYSGQLLLVLETLTGAAVLLRTLVRKNFRLSSPQIESSLWKSVRPGIVILAFITLGAGFVAGALGYLSLARILASEVIAGGTMAVGLYTFVLIAIGIVSFSLLVWPLRCLRMVANNLGLIERRIYRVLVWAAVVVFIYRLLIYTGFLNPTVSFIQGILALKFERGSVSVTVEDIVAFFLTVWASYLLSALLRFILQEDVYPRIGVQKGMAYAASSLINYILLALGFVVGLGVIGVSLTKISVLAGAFGVGIGFGLQSIVNNFVSGLILLFERPLHVGDTIELGDISGEVKSIGIRSSTVRTFRGADIVVPNADLVTKQVTNWTLGDKLRRIDLPVGVNYGADPENVIQIFVKVARAHPDVSNSPAPIALFKGYGDSSINFELRAWTDKLDRFPKIRSDLATAIYHACPKEGITFPFPQREVRILGNVSEGLAGAVSEGSLSLPHPNQGEDLR
jgi:small-conductance mechanosensitive channel